MRLAVDEEIVITRHGGPAGVLIGFEPINLDLLVSREVTVPRLRGD